jgi:hypothetical protein
MTTTGRAARLEELLRAYQDALDIADAAPPVVFPRRSRRPVLRLLRRLRPTWYLRLLVRQHVTRGVEKLRRCYAARAALGPADQSLAAERRLLDARPARDGKGILKQRLRPLDGFRDAVATGAATRSTGAYELEAAMIGELGGRPLRELPLDLCASLVLVYPVAVLGGVTWSYGASWDDPTGIHVGMAWAAVALVRVAWLTWVWRRRSRVWCVGGRGAGEARPEALLAPAAAL